MVNTEEYGSVDDEECGKYGVWKMWSVGKDECEKCEAWKTLSVKNVEH